MEPSAPETTTTQGPAAPPPAQLNGSAQSVGRSLQLAKARLIERAAQLSAYFLRPDVMGDPASFSGQLLAACRKKAGIEQLRSDEVGVQWQALVLLNAIWRKKDLAGK